MRRAVRLRPVSVVVALALAGCALPLRANEGLVGGVPAIAPERATEVLAQYESARRDAWAAGDLQRLAQAETGVSYRVDAAALQAGDAEAPVGGYTDVETYIPRLSTYPRWYVIAARSAAASDRSTLLLFVREQAAQPWRQAAAIDIATADRPPMVTDGEGLAVALGAEAPGLRAAPGEVAASHAAWLAGEGEGFAPDRWTEELQTSAADDRARFPDAEVTVTDAVADLPAYALRTEDGGALVLYATQRTFSATSDVRGWQLDGVFSSLAGVEEFEETLSVHWIYGWAALVPPDRPPGTGEIKVLGRSGGIYAVDGE